MRPSPQERLEELDEGEDAEEEDVPPGEGGRCVGAARPVLHGGGALSCGRGRPVSDLRFKI